MLKSRSLPEICPYSEFFWSIFSCIWTEYGEILHLFVFSRNARKTPNMDTFHAVDIFKDLAFYLKLFNKLYNIGCSDYSTKLVMMDRFFESFWFVWQRNVGLNLFPTGTITKDFQHLKTLAHREQDLKLPTVFFVVSK